MTAAGQTESWKIAAAFAAVYIIWGSTYLAIRVAIETIPPFMMAGVRFVVAGAIMFSWAAVRRIPKPSFTEFRQAAVIGVLLLFGGNGGVSWAEQTIPSGLTAVIVATVPLWMTIIDYVMSKTELPGPGTFFGLALGLLGVVLLVAPWQPVTAQLDPIGVWVLLAATFSWSIGSIYSRRAVLPESQIMATALEMLAGGSVLLLAASVTNEWFQLKSASIAYSSLFSLAYLISFGSFVGFTAYMWLLKVSTPSRVSTYAYVNPILAVFLGWALAGETLTVYTGLATAIILASVVIVTARRT